MKVHELIAKEENWTQGCNARDKDGEPTALQSGEAVCWCLIGASAKCYAENGEYHQVWRKIAEHLGEDVLTSVFNDTSTHAEVLALARQLDI